MVGIRPYSGLVQISEILLDQEDRVCCSILVAAKIPPEELPHRFVEWHSPAEEKLSGAYGLRKGR
jgi:hypothetical protein